MIVLGVVSVISGVVAFAWPGVTLVALVYMIAAWAIARGIFEILAAIRLRNVIEGEFFLGLAGAASIVFGIVLMAWPGAGLLTLAWLIGIGAITFGMIQVLLALKLKGFRDRLQPAA